MKKDVFAAILSYLQHNPWLIEAGLLVTAIVVIILLLRTNWSENGVYTVASKVIAILVCLGACWPAVDRMLVAFHVL